MSSQRGCDRNANDLSPYAGVAGMSRGGIAHIVTVGTSVIRNVPVLAPRLGLPDELVEKFRRWAQAPPRSPEDAEAGRSASPGCEEFERALDVLASDPYVVSAELNAMKRYLEARMVDAAVLLASDTGASEFSARVLGEYLSSGGIRVEVHRVRDLGLDFHSGLLNLIDAAAAAITKYRREGYRVWINLTGGFKLETAILYLAACLSRMGVERAYYIHETMKDTVEVPVIPVKLEDYLVDAVRALGAQEAPLDEAEARIGRRVLDELLRRGIAERVGTSVRVRKWVAHLVGGL